MSKPKTDKELRLRKCFRCGKEKKMGKFEGTVAQLVEIMPPSTTHQHIRLCGKYEYIFIRMDFRKIKRVDRF